MDMAKKKTWKSTVTIHDEEDHSVMTLEVNINKFDWKQNIYKLNVEIDHYVQFYELLQQVMGYYNQPITIEPYEEVKK